MQKYIINIHTHTNTHTHTYSYITLPELTRSFQKRKPRPPIIKNAPMTHIIIKCLLMPFFFFFLLPPYLMMSMSGQLNVVSFLYFISISCIIFI